MVRAIVSVPPARESEWENATDDILRVSPDRVAVLFGVKERMVGDFLGVMVVIVLVMGSLNDDDNMDGDSRDLLLESVIRRVLEEKV